MEKRAKGGGNVILYTQVIETEGDKRLFEEVYTAYCGRMLALARQKLSSAADAEDAVQQAFLSLAERFSRLARLPKTQLEAYLVVVVERKCIDILRQRSRQADMPFREDVSLFTPPPSGNTVADAMGKLNPRYREALLLRYGCGYSTAETAQLLHLSRAAAQKLLQRAKSALRKLLEKEGERV